MSTPTPTSPNAPSEFDQSTPTSSTSALPISPQYQDSQTNLEPFPGNNPTPEEDSRRRDSLRLDSENSINDNSQDKENETETKPPPPTHEEMFRELRSIRDMQMALAMEHMNMVSLVDDVEDRKKGGDKNKKLAERVAKKEVQLGSLMEKLQVLSDKIFEFGAKPFTMRHEAFERPSRMFDRAKQEPSQQSSSQPSSQQQSARPTLSRQPTMPSSRPAASSSSSASPSRPDIAIPIPNDPPTTGSNSGIRVSSDSLRPEIPASSVSLNMNVGRESGAETMKRNRGLSISTSRSDAMVSIE